MANTDKWYYAYTIEGVYNLNGQKVNKAQKGMYIINGHKVVIKWEKTWACSRSFERERARAKLKVVIKWESLKTTRSATQGDACYRRDARIKTNY